MNSNFFYLQREIRLFMGELHRGQERVDASDDDTLDGHGHEDYNDHRGQSDESLDVEPFMYDSIKHLAELHRASNNGLSYVGYSEFLARVVRVVHPTLDAWSPCAVLATPLYVCQIEMSGRLHW